MNHPTKHHKPEQTITNRPRERSLNVWANDCASEGTVAFGVSSAAGAAVAELAPLSGAFMLLAIFGKGVIANWRGPNF